MPKTLLKFSFSPGGSESYNRNLAFLFDIGVMLLNKDFEIFKGRSSVGAFRFREEPWLILLCLKSSISAAQRHLARIAARDCLLRTIR